VENKLGGHKKNEDPFCAAAEGHFAGVFLGQSSSFSPLSLPPNAHCVYWIVGGRNNGKVGPDAARGCRISQQPRDPPEISAILSYPSRRKFEILSARFALHEENFCIQLFLNSLRQN
jgi:hypothetical protein